MAFLKIPTKCYSSLLLNVFVELSHGELAVFEETGRAATAERLKGKVERAQHFPDPEVVGWSLSVGTQNCWWGNEESLQRPPIRKGVSSPFSYNS